MRWECVGKSEQLRKDNFVYNVELASPDRVIGTFSDNSIQVHSPINMSPVSCRTTSSRINALQTTNENTFMTCCDDSMFQIWDCRAKSVASETKIGDKPLLSMCSNDMLVAFGSAYEDHESNVVVWDTRQKSVLRKYVESHNDDITVARFEKGGNQRLLTGSMDGLINVYDINIQDEDECILSTSNHGSSIHCSDFLGDNAVYGLSHMETLSTYDIEVSESKETGHQIRAYGDLRQVSDRCQYVCNILQCDGQLYMGYGCNAESTFDVIPWDFSRQKPDHRSLMTLKDCHNGDIVRDFAYDLENRVLYTGGEDGVIQVSRPAENDEQRSNARKTGSSRKARFGPY